MAHLFLKSGYGRAKDYENPGGFFAQLEVERVEYFLLYLKNNCRYKPTTIESKQQLVKVGTSYINLRVVA